MCMGLPLKLLLLSLAVSDLCVSSLELPWFIALLTTAKESFRCNNYMAFIVWLLSETSFLGVLAIIGGQILSCALSSRISGTCDSQAHVTHTCCCSNLHLDD